MAQLNLPSNSNKLKINLQMRCVSSNDGEATSPQERNVACVTFLGLPLFRKETDKGNGVHSCTLLGGLWHERRAGKYKKICICGLQVYSRSKLRKKLLGITLQRYDYEGSWLRALAQRVGDEYDDVYLLRHNMGETYIELAHLEERARVHGSEHPVVVAPKKKYEDVYRMFLPDWIAVRYIPLKQSDIFLIFREQGKEYREAMIRTLGHRFFCSTPNIVRHMLKLMRKDRELNFYRYICESTGVQPLTTKLPIPRIATKDVADAERLRERDGLIEGKYVVLLPEARSMKMLDTVFWQTLSAELTRRGYGVYTNRTDRNGSDLPVGLLLELCRCAAGVITMGSGMAVLLTSIGQQMDLIYTTLRLPDGGKCDAAKVMHLYSVYHLPGVDRQVIREYDGSRLKQDELTEQILKHYDAR